MDHWEKEWLEHRGEPPPYEAQAEITRLQAEVERLKRDSYSREWAEMRFTAAWNDAIEAAALLVKEWQHPEDIRRAIRALRRPTP